MSYRITISMKKEFLRIKSKSLHETLHSYKKFSISVKWTCSLIRSSPMMFLTSTADEIEAMENEEFVDCIPDIGKITDLKISQRDACLLKAKTVFLIMLFFLIFL